LRPPVGVPRPVVVGVCGVAERSVFALDASGRDKLKSWLMSVSSSGPAILMEERAVPALLPLKTGARAISRACASRNAVSNPS
jgi:hypothetical protein